MITDGRFAAADEFNRSASWAQGPTARLLGVGGSSAEPQLEWRCSRRASHGPPCPPRMGVAEPAGGPRQTQWIYSTEHGARSKKQAVAEREPEMIERATESL